MSAYFYLFLGGVGVALAIWLGSPFVLGFAMASLVVQALGMVEEIMRRDALDRLWCRAYRSIPGTTPEERGAAVMRFLDEIHEKERDSEQDPDQ